MDTPRFVDHYRDLILVLRKCGLSIPWISTPQSLVKRILYLANDILVIVLMVYPLFTYVYTFFSTSLSFQDLCADGIAAGGNVCGFLVNMYHLQNRYRLEKLTNAIDKISEKIMKSDFGKKEEFLKEYKYNAKLMNTWAKNIFISSFFTCSGYFLPLPIIEWYTGNYRAHLPLPISHFFNDKQPGVYELIVLMIIASIVVSIATKAANDCLFVSLLKIQTIFFKYLYGAQDTLRKQLTNNVQSHYNFKEWVKLHQEIIKNNEELVQTFSPIIIIYYLIVIEIVVCGAFVESMKDNDNIFQSVSVGAFVFITIVYYFLLSNTANELANEAEKLSFVLYSLPWYQMKRSNISMLKLALTMNNKPRQLTAYKAPVFLLNREMFVGFVTAATSAFVTFLQMGASSQASASTM